MSEFFDHPAVQVALVPLVVALTVAALLHRIRLAGLALVIGFAAAVALVSGLAFTPLTVTRKVVLVGLAAPVIGIVLDFAKLSRPLIATVAAIAAGLSVWVFWAVLTQKELSQFGLLAVGLALFVGFVVGATLALADDPVRAGAAGVGLGLGTAVSAVVSASALYFSYGGAIAAACGGFLLWQMLSNKNTAAGATFTLPLGLLASLCAGAALLLAQLPWYCLPALALIPVAAWLPLPSRMPVGIQAVVACLYTVAVGAGASLLAWRAAVGAPT